MSDTATAPVRFHLSLNVSDLDKAVSYFEQLFGVPAAKQRADYAKFELESPPLVLSLEPRSPARHGSLNHVGFRFPDSAALVDVQRRLEQAGIQTQREEGVECCYSRQTKFWVHDFDQRLWEYYLVEDDLDHRGPGQSLEEMVGTAAEEIAAEEARPPVVYDHFMGQPFSPPDEPCDEIRLRGTFNLPGTRTEILERLQQASRHLVSGGLIHLHQLTGDEAVPADALNLPGPASAVKHVPVRTELLDLLTEAGFQQITLVKLGSAPCFVREGVELRETIIEARRGPDGGCEATFDVVYRGPFARLVDDEGHVFPRGERVAICDRTWRLFQEAGVTGQFTRLPNTAHASGACGLTSLSAS